KNQLTKQNFRDAINQYKNDRHPRELLFQFKRCLVHFALDTDEVWMRTKLDGKNTKFLPFKKGKKSNSALPFPDTAENPPNPNRIKTDYLWKEILAKENLSNIIENYAQLIEEENKYKDKKNSQKAKTNLPTLPSTRPSKANFNKYKKTGSRQPLLNPTFRRFRQK
ncbi:MAG: hypothetical protein O4753_14245, partial [Trichodesmium sp. St7_bin2_1]|nr:hypothetical protein [Trichodesmium sp. St7_bin2_1]